MLQPFQFDNLWIGLALWVVSYLCDYYMTLYANRLRMQYTAPYIEIEGSFELNPYYQKDIDSQRKVSSRFIFMLLFVSGWLAFTWFLADMVHITALIFPVALGIFLIPEFNVLGNHIILISTFRMMSVPGAAEGHLKQARWMIVRATAHRMGYWALFCFILFLLTGNLLLFGGALGELRSFLRYNRMSVRLQAQSPAKPATSEVAVQNP